MNLQHSFEPLVVLSKASKQYQKQKIFTANKTIWKVGVSHFQIVVKLLERESISGIKDKLVGTDFAQGE